MQLKFFTALFLLFVSSIATANDIDKNIQAILARVPDNLNVGITVQSMETGKIVYESNANRYFTPASTQKILTAAAALFYLGKDYQFNTLIYSDRPYNGEKILKGNLYIKFGGDPNLTVTHIQEMISQLKKMGLKKITGKVYIDNTHFNGDPYASGWIWDDANSCFSAPVDAIMINHNCFNATLIAGKKEGGKTQIKGDSALLRYTPIDNEVVTRKNITLDDTECILDVSVDQNNRYHLTGCVSPKASDLYLSFALRYVKPFTQKLLTDLFAQQQITVGGNIEFSAIPQQSFEIVRHASPPLSELVRSMLKRSDNLIADGLFKSLGAAYYKKSGNWVNGARAVSEILKTRAQVTLDTSKIYDGSGLSRYNLLTPNNFSELLYAIYHDEVIGGDFINGLPLFGVDGTLANKMSSKDKALQAALQAKTGSMSGVLSLAGYVYTKKKKVLSIVILMNNFPNKSSKYFFTQMEIANYFTANF
jgi:D-alanyl-D-alanine carboxypeptidase/D-alanyl-D-alanine-endopeptidase (penicillin-binding protein 4)